MAALSNGSNGSSLCSWYPHKPILDDDDQDRITTSSTIVIDMTNKPNDTDKTLESINWDPSLKYAEALWWSSNIKKEKKEACRRRFVKGIEVRGMLYTLHSPLYLSILIVMLLCIRIDLGPDHVLCGERGVFATEKFDICDVIGEYTGRVVDDTVNGHYVAVSLCIILLKDISVYSL